MLRDSDDDSLTLVDDDPGPDRLHLAGPAEETTRRPLSVERVVHQMVEALVAASHCLRGRGRETPDSTLRQIDAALESACPSEPYRIPTWAELRNMTPEERQAAMDRYLEHMNGARR